MLDLLGKRYLLFGLSLLVIIPGLVLLAFTGFPLSIDFSGGSSLEVRFGSGKYPEPSQVIQLYESLGIKDTQVTTTGSDILIIKSTFLDDATRETLVKEMGTRFNQQITVLQFDSVGPTIGREVTGRAASAVAVSALAVVLYIAFAFRGVPHAFRYGICAIIAMLHDVLVVISISAIGAKLFGWEIDSLFITALLSVIGYSVQDKVVVFDRIRENSNIYRKLPFEKLANHSIIQTLQRSINTQLMTVEYMLLALALFGGVTLREFSVILLIGLFSGTYSSIFIAAPILVVWENKEWKNWFKRSEKTSAA
ncbi:MAG TPA: protein translocase subunit SecF [Anaerolineaceae bacterium]